MQHSSTCLTRFSVIVSVVFILLIALVPSLFAQPDDATDHPLVGTEWQLVSIAGKAPLADTTPTVMFDVANALGGSGGCNTYGGTYTVDGDSLTITDIFSTMMFCADGISEQETAFFAALQTAIRYEILDGQLVITYGEGETLVFERVVNLLNTRWRLVSLAGELLLPDTDLTLEFGAADAEIPNVITGSGGCNTFRGTYTLEGETISFSNLISTRKACMEADHIAQETAYFTALRAATGYGFDGQTLTLVYGENGETLVFARLSDLVGTQWQLNTIVDDEVASTVVGVVTLQLDEAGSATGNGGCNTYGSRYTTNGDQISFAPIISTKMACAEDGLMAQETAYYAALQAATRYELKGDTLTIYYGAEGDGQALIFTPAAATSTLMP